MRHRRSTSSGRKHVLVDAAWLAVGITLLPFIAVCWGCDEVINRTKRNHRERRTTRHDAWAAERRRKELLENAPQPLPAHRARTLSVLPTSKSQAQSAFLTRLPLEVRQEIYAYVIGGSLAHIVRKGRKLAHVRCKHSQGEDLLRWCRTAAIGTCHDNASMLASTSNGNIALLRSCSQIYNEAIGLLYASNTFDFDHQDLFLFFSRSILPPRLAAIRRLHLNLDLRMCIKRSFIWADAAPHGWSLMWDVIGRDMPGLKHLILRLSVWTNGLRMEDRWVESMLQLRNLKTFEMSLDVPTSPWFELGEESIDAAKVTLLNDHIRGIVCSSVQNE
ncbi:MAG: hypothetical protein LQ345_007399 [Seirophora villosa]|nr:MAG: hypothetical protein LQ345_007399 [Seirophora villosa]